MKVWTISFLAIFLAACSSPGVTSSAIPPAESPGLIPAQPTQLPEQPANPDAITQTSGPFTLTINSPADQSVVSDSQVDIVGEVSGEAVLTINDEVYLLPSGPFTQRVVLEEGPNALQIVASDMDGNEVDLILTVIYQP